MCSIFKILQNLIQFELPSVHVIAKKIIASQSYYHFTTTDKVTMYYDFFSLPKFYELQSGNIWWKKPRSAYPTPFLLLLGNYDRTMMNPISFLESMYYHIYFQYYQFVFNNYLKSSKSNTYFCIIIILEKISKSMHADSGAGALGICKSYN